MAVRLTTWREVLLAYTCKHPRMKYAGYYVTDSAWMDEWDCPDCGQYGDSAGCYGIHDLNRAWGDYVADEWLHQAGSNLPAEEPTCCSPAAS